MSFEDYLRKTDPKLLREQRAKIIEMAWAGKDLTADSEPVAFHLAKTDIDLLEGLTNFLDGIADIMADELGMEEVLLTEGEEEREE